MSRRLADFPEAYHTGRQFVAGSARVVALPNGLFAVALELADGSEFRPHADLSSERRAAGIAADYNRIERPTEATVLWVAPVDAYAVGDAGVAPGYHLRVEYGDAASSRCEYYPVGGRVVAALLDACDRGYAGRVVLTAPVADYLSEHVAECCPSLPAEDRQAVADRLVYWGAP